MNLPKVSVAMPVYNGQRYLAQAIESILAQTLSDFEFLIVDDGSTDGSLSIIRHFARLDRRIKVISRPNTGIVGALNEMLSLARADLVARMDADDIALHERLSRQVHYMEEHPNCVMAGSRVIVIDPDGDALTVMGNVLDHDGIVAALLDYQGQMVYHPSVMYRRRTVLELGGYRPDLKEAEDLDLFLRLADVGEIVNLPECLLRYRDHPQKSSMSRSQQLSEHTRLILHEARQRRGLQPAPQNVITRASLSSSVGEAYRKWGWWALMSGYVVTARKHAWSSLRHTPLSVDSWRLLYCALRGRSAPRGCLRSHAGTPRIRRLRKLATEGLSRP